MPAMSRPTERDTAVVTPVVALVAMIVALLATSVAAGQESRHERTATPAAAGPNRLAIDAALLDGARPLRYEGPAFRGGLEDLRLFDARGIEVPYVVVPPPGEAERWIYGAVIAIPSTKKESGFDVDLGAIQRVDGLRIDDLPTPFLKRLRGEASGDRGRWVSVMPDGTLFDLPAEHLSSTKLVFPPGDYRYLRIIWDDRSSARVPLPRRVAARDARRATAAATLFDTSFTRRPSEPRHSRFRVLLPARHLPIVALVIDCEETTLLREAVAEEIRMGQDEAGPVEIGAGTLRRVETGGAVADDLRIPVRPPLGHDVELVVDDGDNPPLRITSVRIELPPLPSLYFESPDGGAVTARWGDLSLEAPRYDLAAKSDSIDPAAIPEARWSGEPVRAESGGAAPIIELGGAAIDLASFRYRRSVPAAPRGLASLLIDAAALAHSNGLADLRIADAAGRQVPYLVERRDEPLEVPLVIPPRHEPRAGSSRYELALPWATLPDGARLVVTTGSRVFERDVAVRALDPRPTEREPRTLATARWRGVAESPEPPPLVLPIAIHGLERIVLEITEGDNAPLILVSARLLLPTVRLRFLHPGGRDLALVYGNSRIEAPRYDLALLAPRLFAEPATEIDLGDEQADSDPGESRSRRIFWVVIVLSTIALAVLIARMLRGDAV